MNKCVLLLGVGLLMLGCLVPPLCAADAKSARGLMDDVIQQGLAVLKDKSLSTDARREKFEQIAYANMNFEVMGKMSLGASYRSLSADQQTKYQQTFKQLIANTYGHLIDDYTDEEIKISGDRQEQRDDWTVVSHITGTKNGAPNSEIAEVDYRLRRTDGQWKVIDFTVDNVSMVQNYRSQFQGIMSNGGIDQLLKLLSDKIAANTK